MATVVITKSISVEIHIPRKSYKFVVKKACPEKHIRENKPDKMKATKYQISYLMY